MRMPGMSKNSALSAACGTWAGLRGEISRTQGTSKVGRISGAEQ